MNPLKPYLVAFLLLLMSAQFLYQAGFIVYFTANKALIIKEFCKNKDKPQLKCDGKCHLKKYVQAKLKQAQQAPDTENTPSLPDFKDFKSFNPYYIADQVCNWEAPSLFPHHDLIGQQLGTVFFYQENKGRKHSDALFHPPLV